MQLNCIFCNFLRDLASFSARVFWVLGLRPNPILNIPSKALLSLSFFRSMNSRHAPPPGSTRSETPTASSATPSAPQTPSSWPCQCTCWWGLQCTCSPGKDLQVVLERTRTLATADNWASIAKYSGKIKRGASFVESPRVVVSGECAFLWPPCIK